MTARAGQKSALVLGYMIINHPKKVCIFVDGENMRHSLADLFPDVIKKEDYLPKANWGKFFDWVAVMAGGEEADRIRTYWYVVQNIDFRPFNLNQARKDDQHLIAVLCRDKTTASEIQKVKEGEKVEVAQEIAKKLQGHQDAMEKRFDGWTYIQNAIAGKFKAVEFRRAGAIRYDLFSGKLGLEKAVDVNLATDLIKLKDIYDVAVIVSGDQDYVPAVDTIKDLGKHVVSVAFETQDGKLLPGGARRLNQATDWSVQVKYCDLKDKLELSPVKAHSLRGQGQASKPRELITTRK